MLSFHIVNLIIPEEPEELTLDLPSGTWTLSQHPRYSEFKEAIGKGQCAETYFLEHPAEVSGGADDAMEEITPILLAASYFTGLSITINWFDEYLHAALGLGAPRQIRFSKADLMGLNAYSI